MGVDKPWPLNPGDYRSQIWYNPFSMTINVEFLRKDFPDGFNEPAVIEIARRALESLGEEVTVPPFFTNAEKNRRLTVTCHDDINEPLAGKLQTILLDKNFHGKNRKRVGFEFFQQVSGKRIHPQFPKD